MPTPVNSWTRRTGGSGEERRLKSREIGSVRDRLGDYLRRSSTGHICDDVPGFSKCCMSYCRWSNSDIYLYLSPQGIVCCCCSITSQHFVVSSGIDPIEHLDLRGKMRRRPWKQMWLIEQQRIAKRGGLTHREAIFTNRSAALTHIAQHRAMGEYVSLDVDARLRAEIEAAGDAVCPHRVRAWPLLARIRPCRDKASSRKP